MTQKYQSIPNKKVTLKVERSVVINAPAENVFSYISKPLNELQLNPNLSDIRDITGQGVGQRWSWTYKIMGKSLEGETEVIEYSPNNRYVTKTTGDISSIWTYTLKPTENGTLLSLLIDGITVPIPGQMFEHATQSLSERVATMGIARIKAKMES